MCKLYINSFSLTDVFMRLLQLGEPAIDQSCLCQQEASFHNKLSLSRSLESGKVHCTRSEAEKDE